MILLLLYISTSSFGRKRYTMTKEDFTHQFNENHYLKRVYCQNEKGQKVWLYCNNNTILTIGLKNSKTEDLILQTIKLKRGIIEAIKYNVWIPSKRINNFHLTDVTTITIERKFQESEMPYFDMDSSLTIAKQKNDSLKNIFSDGNENIIVFTKKENSKIDTIKIIQNACYNLRFRDGHKTEYGVVEKITKDSLYISNFFNSQMAAKHNKPFELLSYNVNELLEISMLKPGGYSYNIIQIKDYTISSERRKKEAINRPFWFAVSPSTGEVNFYRLWQTDQGFTGITEKDGNAIWYEGEKTE